VAGGLCHICHGQDAEGTQLGPNLTDGEWLNTDGSYQGIVNTIISGVATPKKYPGAMPPRGGSPLTDDQVRAVAAYVDAKTP
jgi:mono/diheme cytochrome c family protein